MNLYLNGNLTEEIFSKWDVVLNNDKYKTLIEVFKSVVTNNEINSSQIKKINNISRIQNKSYCYWLLSHYYINNNADSTIFNNSYTWIIKDKLSITKMKSSLKYLNGLQDFTSFRSSGCQANSPLRHIINTSIMKNKNIIIFSITANAFLYHMVRNIIGTIVDVGTNKITPSDLRNIINKKDRKYCSKMAPANGLFLWKVSYPRKYKINYNSESILL